MPRESIQKQHLVVNKHGKFIVLLEATTVKHRESLSHNPGSPRRSLYSQPPPPHPENIFFLLFLSCDSATLCRYWKKVMWFISDPWKQTSHPVQFVFLEASTNTSLLENKNVKLVSISVPEWKTQEIYESGAKAWASQIKKVFKRASMRTLRLGNPRGKS